MQKPGNNSFPSSPEDAAKAKNHLVKMIFSPAVRAKIVQALKMPDEQAAVKLGEIIGMTVFRIVSSAKEQKGMKVHIKLTLGLIQQGVEKVAKIMALMKRQMTPEMKQMIGQVAGGIVEQMVKQGAQKQQPQQGQMQGQGQMMQQGQQPAPTPQGLLDPSMMGGV